MHRQYRQDIQGMISLPVEICFLMVTWADQSNMGAIYAPNHSREVKPIHKSKIILIFSE